LFVGTISGVGKSFEAEPVYREESEPPIKMCRVMGQNHEANATDSNRAAPAQRKTLTSLSADLQIHIESFLDPESAASVARCSIALRQAHIDRILLVNPEVAGRLAILDENTIHLIWKQKLASQKDSIKTLVLPEPRDHFVPGPNGFEFLGRNLKDTHTVRHFANIERNTPQVQHIDMSNFHKNGTSWLPREALTESLCYLNNLKSIHQLGMNQHNVCSFVYACTSNHTLKRLEKLDIVNAEDWTNVELSSLFEFQLKSLSINNVNTSSALLELVKHGDVVTKLKLDICEKEIPADVIQKIAKSFPNLTLLNINMVGTPSNEMIAALDNWLTKENLPRVQTVAITVKLSDSLIVPIKLNLHEKSFASAIKVIDSL
jgi:hypothetical protein